MAKISKGILGGFSGKVGPVIGYNWRGQEMIRAVPKKGKKEPSELQVMQRAKFALVVIFLTPLRDFLERYYLRSGGLRTRFNNATGHSIRYAVSTDGSGNFVLEYAKILISSGQLRAAENVTVTPVAGTKLEFSWTDNSGQGNASERDQFCVVGYLPELNAFEIFEKVAGRADANVAIALSPQARGQKMHVWSTFVSENGKKAAVSSYLGLVTNT